MPSDDVQTETNALLVEQLRAGNEDAFVMLVERYQLPLYRYLVGFIADQELAQDLTQETFLRAFQSIKKLQDAQLLRSWLYQIAHNQACSVLRRRRIVRWLPLAHFQEHHSITMSDAAHETIAVTAALRQLPDEQRAALLLHLVAGFSYLEIATMLGLSEGAVRMRISRGRAAFREAYGE